MTPDERTNVLQMLDSGVPYRDFDGDSPKGFEGILQELSLHACPVEPEQGTKETDLEREALQLRGVDVR